MKVLLAIFLLGVVCGEPLKEKLLSDLSILEKDISRSKEESKDQSFLETKVEAKECGTWDVACKLARGAQVGIGKVSNAARTGWEASRDLVTKGPSEARDRLSEGATRSKEMSELFVGRRPLPNDYVLWGNLMRLNPSSSMVDKTDPVASGAEVQRIKNGHGRVNVDVYSLDITCPSGVIKSDTAGKLFDLVRLSIFELDKIVPEKLTIFAGESWKQTLRWLSSNPSDILGSLVTIAFPNIPIGRSAKPFMAPVKAPLDYAESKARSVKDPRFTPLMLRAANAINALGAPARGSVVCSEYSRSGTEGRWVFSTIKTKADGYHPLSGNREFGVKKTSDTKIHVWTKAVDRFTGLLIEMGTNTLLPGKINQAQDINWKGFLDRIAKIVSERSDLLPGCSAQKVQTRVDGLDWTDVQKSGYVPV